MPVYTEYAIRTEYVWDYGLAVGPIAGVKGTQTEYLRLYAPTCLKVVTWTATCIGARPTLPSPDTGSSNEILLRKEVVPQAPGLLADVTQVWTVSGRYVYGLQVPPADGDSLEAGSIPLDATTPDQNRVNPGDFAVLLSPVPAVTPTASVTTIDPKSL